MQASFEVAEELLEFALGEFHDLRLLAGEGDNDQGAGDVEAEVAVDVIGAGDVGSGLERVFVLLVRCDWCIGSFPVQQRRLSAIVA